MRQSPLKYLFAILNSRRMNEKGIVLPILVSFVLIFVLIAVGLGEYAANAMRVARSQENQVKSLYMAEAATEKVLAAVRLSVSKNGVIPSNISSITTAPQTGGKFTLTNFTITSGTLVYKKLTSGDYAGLNANVQPVTIAASAISTSSSATVPVIVSQAIEIQHIPVFQFGIFYQNDLEIGPGVNMTITGAVHTNSDLYVTADNGVSVTFDSRVTSAKSILHKLKEGGSESGVQGDVFFKDASNVNQNMKNADSTWLDSNYSTWLLDSQTKWNGNVQASVHGVVPLTLPLQTGTQPHDIIERRTGSDSSQLQTQKFDYKAQLRIIDGVVYNQAGSTVELRYCSGGGTFSGGTCPQGQTVVNPISTSSFHDFREAKTVHVTDVDINKMNSSPAFVATVNANNGVIIYGSDLRNSPSSTDENAFRLINGTQLPNKGMTFASENPVFVKGSYNTVSKQTSGIVSDSFNVLSGSWNDANASSSVSSRVASNTTINAAVLSGNTDSTPGKYNGGIENAIRLLENWSGKTLTYSGSIAILYNGQTGTGQWGNSNVYSPPARNWSYDTTFSNPNYSIPGFPSIFSIVKTSYEQT